MDTDLDTVIISIHAPHTGRDEIGAITNTVRHISIHAPHTGRDYKSSESINLDLGISIHAPHTGRDGRRYDYDADGWDFNPRAPYGARLEQTLHQGPEDTISIHAPHTGRDTAYL